MFNCLKSVRQHYPDAPIYLMCDNGNDYTEVAKHFNCTYIHLAENSPVHLLVKDGTEHNQVETLNRYRTYLTRMTSACEYLDTDYIMRLEDDVRCRGKIWHIPNYDIIGSLNVHATINTNTNYYINLVRGVNVETEKVQYFINGGGGSLFKRTSMLAYITCMLDNWKLADTIYNLSPNNYASVDVIDGVAMLLLGYSVGRSMNILDQVGDELPQCCFFHPYKNDYNVECNLQQLLDDSKHVGQKVNDT